MLLLLPNCRKPDSDRVCLPHDDDPNLTAAFVPAGFDWQDLSDARVTLTGDMTPVPDAEVAAVRDLFLAKHPDCFYVDFGDFAFYRMDNIVAANFIGGFGRVAQVLLQATVFPVCASCSVNVCILHHCGP